MAGVSRRQFLYQAGGASAALTFMAASGVKLHANPLGLPIGSQTYPHLARIQSGDFAGLLKDMKAIGIEQIELCSPGYTQFESLADGKQTRKVFQAAKTGGVKTYFVEQNWDLTVKSVAFLKDLTLA